MTWAYIDETGFHMASYPEVLADLQGMWRGIYGPDLYLEPDSQDGQMVAVVATLAYDLMSLAQSVYNSYSPQTAQGAGLSRSVKINGLRRKAATYSVVDVVLVGQVGTVITSGIAEDVAGQKWLLPATVTIPVGGEISVTATAQTPGLVRTAPGEITKIGTPTRGWQSVNNPEAAVPGAAVESDAELRRRQAISTALPSLTVFEGTMAAVAAVSGVTRLRGYENDTDEVDANGIPAHSISIVVEGGDTATIAAAIAAKKSVGCGTYGDTSIEVRDKYGIPLTIAFWRSDQVSVYMALTIRARPGYVSSTGQAIIENLAAYLNDLGIGEDVLLSKLYSPINDAEPTAGMRTFDVLSLTIGTDPEALAATNIDIPYNAVAVGSTDNIVVTVV